MSGCESGNCSRSAKHTVTFEDPEEEVDYCTAHALSHYKHDDRATKIEWQDDG